MAGWLAGWLVVCLGVFGCVLGLLLAWFVCRVCARMDLKSQKSLLVIRVLFLPLSNSVEWGVAAHVAAKNLAWRWRLDCGTGRFAHAGTFVVYGNGNWTGTFHARMVGIGSGRECPMRCVFSCCEDCELRVVVTDGYATRSGAWGTRAVL
jgi:hypothetical protein